MDIIMGTIRRKALHCPQKVPLNLYLNAGIGDGKLNMLGKATANQYQMEYTACGRHHVSKLKFENKQKIHALRQSHTDFILIFKLTQHHGQQNR